MRNILGLALGVIARGIHGALPTPSTRALFWLQAGAVVALLLVLATPERRIQYTDFTAPVPIAVLIIACSYDRGGVCPILMWFPLQWLGRISYSLYLTHYMLVLAIAAVFINATGSGLISGAKWMSWALIALVLAVTLAVAHVTYALWELPTRTFLRGLWPARRRAAQPIGS